MLTQESPMKWVLGYSHRGVSNLRANTYTAFYRLTDLIKRGYVDADEGYAMLRESGLDEFSWQITWPEDFDIPDEYLISRIQNVQGYAIFVHGWTGNHTIWEELPSRVVHGNRSMVSISVDHNGFGESIFSNVTPSLESCNPPAAMKTLERWIKLMKLRRQLGDPNRKVLNFIGHSMGGATLFYMNPILWDIGEVTRYALAPALLLEDEMYRTFYTALGLGIGILQRVGAFKIVERMIKPTVINTLCGGASDYVKEIHSVQYNETPRGITGATFMAMGRLDDYEIARNWEFFNVTLGHRDRLVGLTGMMDLLSKLEFPVAHTRVVPGSHYLFSVGTENPHNAFIHAQNRDIVVQDILSLQTRALKVQKEGRLVG